MAKNSTFVWGHAFCLWAKSDPQHPLWCHLIDVGSCAAALWDTVLPLGTRHRMARALGVPVETARLWIVWFAAMHDLGKASPEFQSKDPELAKVVHGAGLRCATAASPTPHGRLSAELITTILIGRGWERSEAHVVALAIGAHHGEVDAPTQDAGLAKLSSSDKTAWVEARRQLVDCVERELGLEALRNRDHQPHSVDRVLLLEIAGFISLADWIGSSADHFSTTDPSRQIALFGNAPGGVPEGYGVEAAQSAGKAIKELGWTQSRASQQGLGWEELFQFDTPNPLQQAVNGILDQHPGTRFLLVEAPMGEGKTEAAFFTASRWIAQGGQSGAYVALPTQATSNAMYQRVNRWINCLYDSGAHQSLLVHGGLIATEDFERIKRETFFHVPSDSDDDAGHQGATRLSAPHWFLPRKRALLAHFGTGTVDQALLAVLLARHHFVRIAGLAGKTIIFDEIHAYDTYTSALIERLLEYLARLDCTVVLLSGTLPAHRREALFKSFTGRDLPPEHRDAAYPRLIGADTADSYSVGGIATSARSRKSIKIDWLSHSLPDALAAVMTQLGDCGCAAFICNTVGDAQELYRCAKEQYAGQLEYLGIFHSRFTVGQRQDIETEVMRLFGRDSTHRPKGRALLVATQVVEQSLDLDFDLMATDIAPVDLLLQRSGRLHRHPREERPAHLATPRLLIRLPEVEQSAPGYGKLEKIYEPAILLRTHSELLRIAAAGGVLAIPEDVAPLIEAVYTESAYDRAPTGWEVALQKAMDEMESNRRKELRAADGRTLHAPSKIASYWRSFSTITSDDDSSATAGDQRALTRLGEPSVRVLCLHRVGEVICFDPEGRHPVPRELDPRSMHQVIRQVAALPLSWFQAKDSNSLQLDCAPWPQWKDYPTLKYINHIQFNHGCYRLKQGRVLRWDPETGISLDWLR